jgi:hypothetical protein
MSQPLATGGFEWVNIATEEEIVHHCDDAEKGYILEVDLEYPKELHDFIYLFSEFIKVGAACISMHIMAAH